MEKIAFPKFKFYTNQPVRYIQAKLDGHLTKIYKDENHCVTAYTKNDKDITDKLWSIFYIRGILATMPAESTIFAELHCPEAFATDVPTMLNNGDDRLRLTAFAAPMIAGAKILDCSDVLDVMKRLQEFGFDTPETRVVSPNKLEDAFSMAIVSKTEQAQLLKEAVERKLEGWVLKEGHMSGWFKLKPTKSFDAFVIGTCESFSEQHFGGLKSINVAVYESVVNKKVIDLGQVGSGFTAEYRSEFNTKEKRDTLIGKVCEVKYDCLASQGKPKFPRFVRWRDDKNAEDCTMDQLKC